MLFEYKARNAAGKMISGSIEATDEHQVIQTLGSTDLIVVNVKVSDANKKAIRKTHKKVPLAVLSPMTRQLATMLRAGLPMIRSLRGISQQEKNPILQLVLEGLVSAVENGMSLAEALQRQPRVFSKLYVCMVQAGERSGSLPEILDQLANYLEASLRLRQKIRSASIYPAIVTVFAIGICIFLITAIIPVFADIYKDFGATLPLPTLVMIQISVALRHYLLLCLGACAAAVFFGIRWRRSRSGAQIWDRAKLNFPVIGKLTQKIALSRFSRTFGTLTHNGVSILETLSIVASASNNVIIESAVHEMATEIEQGASMSEAMARQSVFPSIMRDMASAGEQTGTLDTMLQQVADYYDRDIEAALSGLTSLIEPLLIMFLGVFVGSVVISMFLPIFKMTEVIKF
jgi:type IV pilus assembly protein PilC